MDNIIDNYGYKEDYSYLEEVINEVLNDQNVKNAIYSIIFVSNEEIHKINKEYRNIDRETDVISFAFEDNSDLVYNDIRVLGDIYISIPKMQEQAKEYGHSQKRELSFLCVHGMLHLLGYDHVNNKEEEKIMFDLQDKILNKLGIVR